MADMKATPQQTVVASMRALTGFNASGALAKFTALCDLPLTFPLAACVCQHPAKIPNHD